MREDALSLPANELASRLEHALATGDPAQQYLWARYGRERLAKDGDAPGRGGARSRGPGEVELPFDDAGAEGGATIAALVRQLEGRVRSPEADELLERAREVRYEALGLKDEASEYRRGEGRPLYSFEDPYAYQLPWE